MRTIEYWVMDGRARLDVHKATVYLCASSKQEAEKFIKEGEYGDSVIVKVVLAGNSVVSMKALKEA